MTEEEYSVSQSIEVHLETSPLTPLLIKERGKKQTVPQLLDKRYRAEITIKVVIL